MSILSSIGSPLLGAATSIAGSIVGANQSKKAQKRQNEFNAKEAQKQRDFNAQEAQKSRAYQSQMYYIDRAYNSAKNQSRLYSEAGLNPSLMMSQGAGSMSGQSISAPTASGTAASSTSSDNSGSLMAAGIGQAGQTLAQSALMSAQVSNVNAGTDKIKAETAKTQSETQYQNLVNDNYVEYTGVQIRLMSAQANEKEELTPELKKQINANAALMDEQVKETKKKIEQADQTIANMKQEEFALRLNNFFQSGCISPDDRSYLQKLGFSSDDIEQIDLRIKLNFAMQEASLGNMQMQAFLSSEQGQVLRTQRIKENYFRQQGAWSAEAQTVIACLSNTKWTGQGIQFNNQIAASNAAIAHENIKGAKFNNNYIVQGIKLAMDVTNTAANAYGTVMTGGLSQVNRSGSSPSYNSSWTPVSW